MEVLSSRTIVRAADLGRSRVFYEEVLGLRIYREYGVAGRTTGVVYFLGGGFLEVTGGGSSTGPGAPQPVVLWLQVPDLGVESQRLAEAGVPVAKPAGRMPWGLDELWLEGPDAVEIRLVEVPADHPLRRRVD